jgi:hypothetical protein
MSGPNTPGVGGYALGIMVSWLVVLVSSVFLLGPYVFYLAVPMAVVGIPLFVLGSVLTHFACRETSSQAAHVLVAGLSGFTLAFLLTTGAAADGLGSLLRLLAFPAWVGMAAAIGRASVICLVPEREPGGEAR